jgi:hypothetical protein
MRTEVKTLVSVLVLEVELKLSSIEGTSSENNFPTKGLRSKRRSYLCNGPFPNQPKF